MMRREGRVLVGAIAAVPRRRGIVLLLALLPSWAAMAQQPPVKDAPEVWNATAREERNGRVQLDRALQAMGGAVRVDGVRSYQHVETGHIAGESGEIRVASEWRVEFPETLREDITVDGKTTTRVFRPETSFEVQDGSARRISEQRRREWMSSVIYKPLWLLRARHHPEFRIAARNGRLEVEFQGRRMVVELDGKSRLIAIVRYRDKGWSSGELGTFEWRFSDYRSVDGVMVPFRHEILFEGKRQVWAEMEKVILNPAFERKVFERPA